MSFSLLALLGVLCECGKGVWGWLPKTWAGKWAPSITPKCYRRKTETWSLSVVERRSKDFWAGLSWGLGWWFPWSLTTCSSLSLSASLYKLGIISAPSLVVKISHKDFSAQDFWVQGLVVWTENLGLRGHSWHEVWGWEEGLMCCCSWTVPPPLISSLGSCQRSDLEESEPIIVKLVNMYLEANLHSDPVNQRLLQSPFYREGNWDSKRLKLPAQGHSGCRWQS